MVGTCSILVNTGCCCLFTSIGFIGGPSARSRAQTASLLAEDHKELLLEVTGLLTGDFEVVGVVHDGLSLLEHAAKLKPDVVVTDYKMPEMDGIEAGRRLLLEGHCKAVVLLTLYDDPYIVRAAMEAGIRAYVLKRDAVEKLVSAIHAALKGQAGNPIVD